LVKSDNFCVCPAKHAGGLDNRFRQWLQNPEKILKPYIKKGMQVLDMGCGPGFFSIEIADLVGESGKVFAADLQPEMLDWLKQKTNGTDLEKRIAFHQCQENKIGLSETFDFILLFYMVHEVPDKAAFFKEISNLLKPDGQALMVEPPIHVSKSSFLSFIDIARNNGLIDMKGPNIFLSKTALLKRQ